MDILFLIALISLIAAAIPTLLYLLNLKIYRKLPTETSFDKKRDTVSVLIPARNEASNIKNAVESLLKNKGITYEIIVLDDQSTDDTAQIVTNIAASHKNLKLYSSNELPNGWCGKQFACHQLSKHAKYKWLVYIDADVKLTSNALPRMISYMKDKDLALASGIPQQILGTFSEKLLLPLIHFILLGYLPIHLIRKTKQKSLSAGCGQLFVINSSAYKATGGHSKIKLSQHDGIQLPRLFKSLGFRTGLFDATDIALCRMYHLNKEVWQGLSKNATEGLAAPNTIIQMTVLLLSGQVLPFVLAILLFPWLSGTTTIILTIALILIYIPRFISVFKFHQPVISALIHPIGVLSLLGIQWYCFFKKRKGHPVEWKGRKYSEQGSI